MDMSIGFPNLGIHLEQVGKSIDIFGFEITYYGMIIAAAMLLGIWFTVLEAKRTNQDQDSYLEMLLVAVVTAIVGARLYYVLFSWEYYQGDILEIFRIRNGGLAIYGGIIGGALGALGYCRIKKMSFRKMADTVIPSLMMGQILGRWGNFFNREAFGEYTNNLLAMELPVSAVRPDEITAIMREHIVTKQGIEYIQVHPTFLYESLWILGLLLLLQGYKRRKKFQGELTLMYLAGYGLGRVWIEGLRTDQLLIPGTRLPVSQVLSALLVVTCTISIVVQRQLTKKRREMSRKRDEVEYTNDDNDGKIEEENREKESAVRPETGQPGGSDQVSKGEPEPGSADSGISETDPKELN